MKKHFSSEIMHRIRNDIPINDVIRNVLKMQWKITDGQFRFLCPICRDYNTAVNSKTNLGRCFKCHKNYNPVDMVMVVWKWDFVTTVKVLKKILRE